MSVHVLLFSFLFFFGCLAKLFPLEATLCPRLSPTFMICLSLYLPHVPIIHDDISLPQYARILHVCRLNGGPPKLSKLGGGHFPGQYGESTSGSMST